MTRRTVIWIPEAEAELTEIWLATHDRNQIAASSRAIDRLLTSDAESASSELAEGLLVLEVAPLRVVLEILDEDRVVRIISVRRSLAR